MKVDKENIFFIHEKANWISGLIEKNLLKLAKGSGPNGEIAARVKIFSYFSQRVWLARRGWTTEL